MARFPRRVVLQWIKRLAPLAFVTMVPMLAVACSSSLCDPPSRAVSRPATAPVSAAAKPINMYCPVERDQKVDPAYTVLYHGQLIGFCCEDCVKSFKANPEKYMKDLK